MAKEFKVGVAVGGGPLPGYEWNVWVLNCAFREIQGAFSEVQYWHLVDQMKELARHGDPTHSNTLSIKQVENFYELRDGGGVLGAVNARVFFAVSKDEKTILVLGGIHKQNNGKTPQGDVIRMRRRLRRYHDDRSAG